MLVSTVYCLSVITSPKKISPYPQFPKSPIYFSKPHNPTLNSTPPHYDEVVPNSNFSIRGRLCMFSGGNAHTNCFSSLISFKARDESTVTLDDDAVIPKHSIEAISNFDKAMCRSAVLSLPNTPKHSLPILIIKVFSELWEANILSYILRVDFAIHHKRCFVSNKETIQKGFEPTSFVKPYGEAQSTCEVAWQ